MDIEKVVELLQRYGLVGVSGLVIKHSFDNEPGVIAAPDPALRALDGNNGTLAVAVEGRIWCGCVGVRPILYADPEWAATGIDHGSFFVPLSNGEAISPNGQTDVDGNPEDGRLEWQRRVEQTLGGQLLPTSLYFEADPRAVLQVVARIKALQGGWSDRYESY